MLSREELLKSREYWLANIQNQLFNHIEDYMIKEGLNRTSLAEKLGVTKGYVSQVLNGDFDHRLSKYIDLLIATNVVPKITFENLNDVINKDTNSHVIHASQAAEYTLPVYDNIYNISKVTWQVSNILTGEDKTFNIASENSQINSESAR